MTTVPARYAELAAIGPTASALGSAFVTLVEPHRGHEHAFNRWYEDDHYYSTGAMAIPWWLAGRRWVATRELRDLRRPASSPIADPVDLGCYLGTYWIAAGHWEDQWAWLGTAVARLREEGRMFGERTHVHTAFYDRVASVTRDGEAGPRDYQALDYPYEGLVVEVIDAPAGERTALERWVAAEHAPQLLSGSPVRQCVIFAPRPWPAEDLWFDAAPVPVDRLLLLWFLERDPRACWEALFATEPERLTAAGAGTTGFLAPFVPTLPGTDRYVDELR